jgi:hypothetical protein
MDVQHERASAEKLRFYTGFYWLVDLGRVRSSFRSVTWFPQRRRVVGFEGIGRSAGRSSSFVGFTSHGRLASERKAPETGWTLRFRVDLTKVDFRHPQSTCRGRTSTGRSLRLSPLCRRSLHYQFHDQAESSFSAGRPTFREVCVAYACHETI